MKKLLAFTLLIVHLFNLTGYTLLFTYLGEQSTQQIIKQIDEHNYKDAELIEIKVPLKLPYITSWGDYERIDGEITINGNHHSYVKRKVAGDTLYLLCLPNREKDELQIAKSNFGNDANDLAGKTDKPQLKKAVTFNQFQVHNIHYNLAQASEEAIETFPLISSSLTDSFIDADGRPPRA